MKKSTFQELLEKLRQEKAHKEAAEKLLESLEAEKVEEVDISSLGISEESLNTDQGKEELNDAVRSVLDNLSKDQDSSGVNPSLEQTSGLSSEQEIVQEVPADKTGVARKVTLNEKQAEFNTLVQSGKDCVLVGSAGTGKTTSMQHVTRGIIDSGRIGTIKESTKWLTAGNPGAAILSYTRKAVNNIRHAVVDELKTHTLTAHKLLEFQPVFYEIEDPSGGYKKTMSFEPARTSMRPLPSSLKFLGFEEASMIPVALYELLMDAMPHDFQQVFLGDIQQLPPAFGAGILGFKMLELQVIELTEIYRQALKSPIIRLAKKILEGNPHSFSPQPVEFYNVETVDGKVIQRKRWPTLEAFNEVAFDEDTKEYIGTVKFQPWQKQLDPFEASLRVMAQFKAWEKEGYYRPDDDMVLCPYNETEFGTIELNRAMHQYLGEKRGAVVNEVIAGFKKHYLAVGDRILYDKEDAFVVSISRNINYTGTTPAVASTNLDRWGGYKDKVSDHEMTEAKASAELTEDALDDFLSLSLSSIEDRVQEASHDVVIRYAYSDEEVCLSKAAQVNEILGGHFLTIYKFQGSEAERVFLVFHNSHAKQLSREALYTAVTRARKFLHIICEPKTFFTGVASQRIKGNTIQEKALQFTGLKDEKERVKVAKELAARKVEHDRHVAERLRREEADERRAAEQQVELAKSDVDTAALEALTKIGAPSMDSWTYDPKLGKMVRRVADVQEEHLLTQATTSWGMKSLPDVQSDPAEDLPEPVPYYNPIPKAKEPTAEEIAAKLAERLARIRSKRS